MPTRWCLQLAIDPGTAPGVGSDQLHGLACALFEAAGAEHHGAAKPFAVRPPREHAGAAGAVLGLSWLPDRPPPAGLPAAVRLGARTLPVLASSVDTVPVAALAGGCPPRRVRFVTGSPVLFSRNGADYPLPDPQVVFGGLARRLVAAEPAASGLASDQAVRAVLAAVRIYRCDVRTERVSWEGQVTAGFVGSVVFGLSARTGPDGAALFGALSRFAAFAGLGRGTTHGLGAVDVTVDGDPAPPGAV